MKALKIFYFLQLKQHNFLRYRESYILWDTKHTEDICSLEQQWLWLSCYFCTVGKQENKETHLSQSGAFLEGAPGCGHQKQWDLVNDGSKRAPRRGEGCSTVLQELYSGLATHRAPVHPCLSPGRILPGVIHPQLWRAAHAHMSCTQPDTRSFASF